MSKTFKKVLPILIGSVVVSMLVSILPFSEFAEADNPNKAANIKKVVKETKEIQERKTIRERNVDYISEEQAIEFAMKKVDKKNSEVTYCGIALLYNDPHYIIEITTTNNTKNYVVYIVKVDAITGEIENVDKEHIKIKDEEVKTNNGRFISKYEAKNFALKRVDNKNAFITGFEIHLNDKTPHYLVEVKDTRYEYLIKIDAETGKVLDQVIEKRDVDDDDDYDDYDDYKIRGNSDKINKKHKDKNENKDNKNNKNNKPVVGVKFISKEEAIKIALNKIGKDARLVEFEFENDDNPPKYEIEMVDDKYEYDIEIHAISGAILKFERDDH